MKKLKILFLVKFITALLVFPGLLSSCQKEETVETRDEEILEEVVPFSVMSFNIRNDQESDPQSLDERKESILSIIIDNDPDIVGLQEFSNNWFETWMENKMNELGYDHYIDALAGLGSPKAIFYKKDRFSRKAQATFRMNFSEGRTGTWAIFYDRFNDQDYFISNSHWTIASSADRVKTANTVVSEITKYSNQLPLVVFGDFNAKPGTPEIQILETAQNLNLNNAHEENLRTFHGWDAVGNSKLDYIFHSDALKVTESEVIRTSYNGYWPSDHWPIIAIFEPAK